MKRKAKTKLFEWQQIAKTSKCEQCDKIGCTVDHIIPVFFLEQFCLDRLEMIYNYEKNFQFLCSYHNQLKANRIDIRHPKTFILLEEIINKAKEL